MAPAFGDYQREVYRAGPRVSGRPGLWGLAAGGRDGAEYTLRRLLAELYLTPALSGASTLDAIDASCLRDG